MRSNSSVRKNRSPKPVACAFRPRPLAQSLSYFKSSAAICAAMALAAVPAARAATDNWTAGSGTNFLWDNAANWLGGIPNGSTDVLFPLTIPNPASLTNPSIITLNAGDAANSLTFNGSYTLTGGDLTLSSGNITVGTGANATINSTLNGSNGLTLSGNGTLTLGGSNLFTGSVVLNSGTLSVSSDANFGDASNGVLFGGGTLQIAGTSTFNTARLMLISGSGTLSVQGASDAATLTGSLFGSGTLTVTGAGTLTASGGLADNGGTLSLSKTGSGTLLLTGASTASGGITISGGVLSANATSTLNTVGTGPITLSGGTLQLNPVATTTTHGLSGRVVSTGVTLGDSSLVNFGATASSLRSDATLNVGNGTTLPSNSGIQWIGKLQITNAGAYKFFTNSDDGSRIYIDGVLVVNNDGSKGVTDLGSASFINLSAGLHDIRVDYVNGTGSSGEMLSWASNQATGLDVGTTETIIPTTALWLAESNTAAGASNAVVIGSGSGSAVTVTANSTLALHGSNFTEAQIGALSINTGKTLTLTADSLNASGPAGKALRAAGTITFGDAVTGTGTVTINTTPDLYLDGVASDGGQSMTINKQGSGRLIFDQTTVANSLLSTTTLNIQGGTLTLVGNANAGAFNPIGAAAVQLNGGNMVLDQVGNNTTTGVTYANSISALQSGTIQDVANAATTTLSGPITVASGITLTFDAIAGGQPTTDNGANLVVSGAVTGSGNISLISSILGSLATVKPGTFTFNGNDSGFTGGVTIGSGVTLTSSGANGLVHSGTPVTLSGGSLTELNDLSGTGTPESYVAMGSLTINTGNSSITIGRAGTAFAPYFTTASNKTAQASSLSIGGQTLTINNNNGYGLQITGGTTFGGAPTITVATASASNVVPGLTLSGVVSSATGAPNSAGAVILTKAGAGTLLLANSGNTFGDFGGGSAQIIDITAGMLAAGSDGALGAADNIIRLSTNSTTQGFRAVGAFSTGRTFILNAASNDIDVTAGNTLTLTAPFGLTAPNEALMKNDNGTLAISAANSTWTGGITVSAGMILLSNSTALGGATGGTVTISAAVGAAIQLAGGITIANPLSITASNTVGGINAGGMVESVSGINTWSGAINQVSGNAATFGADAGATLNITGTYTASNSIGFVGAGTINFQTAYPASNTMVKLGTGTTTLSVASPAFLGPVNVNGGLLVIGSSGTGSLGTTTAQAATVANGATLKVNDSGTALANRLGTRPVTLGNGTFEYVVNASAASSETMSALTAGFGGDTVQIDTSGQNATITWSSLAVNGGGYLNFINSGTGAAFGTAADTIKFTTAPGLTPGTTGIIPRVTINGTDFASYNNNGASANTNGLQLYTAYDNSGAYTDINLAGATDTIKIGTGFLTNSTITAPAKTVNAVNIVGNGLTLNGLGTGFITTLTLTSGQLLVNGGTDTIGSSLVLASGATEMGLGINSGSTLIVNGVLSNAANVTKGLGGNLTFNAPQFFNTGNAYFSIHGGLVTLNGGLDTLFPTINQNVGVGPGATLDLNGNSQLIGNLTSPNNNGFAGSGGTVTNSSATQATLVANHGNGSNINFGGQITGNLYFAKGGGGQTLTLYSDNTYTGGSLFMSNVTLIDSGKLSATNSIGINYGNLTIDNTGMMDLPNRVNDAAPISLSGGTITYKGRAQTASSETLGAVSLVQGINVIAINAGGTGVNSADVTLASVTRPAGSSATVIFGAGAGTVLENGQIGSNPRLVFTATPTLTNNIIAPWAIINRDWASYIPSFGVGQLGATGFAGYATNTLNGTPLATDNVKTTASVGPLTANTTINTLNMQWTANATVDLGGFTLDLLGGGLMLATGTSTTSGALNNGTITSGAAGVGGDLYTYFLPYAGTARLASIGAAIADNGSGAVRLIVSSSEGVGTAQSLTLNGVNTYSGGTVVNAGTLNIGATGTLPGNGITLNAAALTQTAGGVIASTNVVNLNGPSTLTLVSNNTLDSLVFNSNGGTTNPAVATGGVLTLSNSTPISFTGSNPGVVPTISGTLDFGGVAKTLSIGSILVNGVSIAQLNASVNISGVIQDSGLITKSGNGNLQLSGQSTFTGGLKVSAGGLIIGANSTPSNTTPVISGPLGTGSLTMASGTTLLADTGTRTVANALSIQGNLNFAGTANLTFAGPITIPSAPFTINVATPTITASLLGPISGSTTTITKTGLGTLALGTYAGTVNLPNGGSLSILTDGDGTGTVNAISDGGFTSAGPTILTIGRAGTTYSPLFTTASNKIIQLSNMSLGGNSLMVNNNNGYGLEFAAAIGLTGNQIYSVTTASASTVVQGLELDGLISGAFNIVKQGAGSLVLGNSGNTFGGTGNFIDIQGGIVSVGADSDLGSSANSVILDANAATGVGLRATGTFSTGRTIQLAQANNAIEVTGGNTLTLTSGFSVSAPADLLVKNDNGVLVLAGSTSTSAWNGAITINAGAVQLAAAQAAGLGTGQISVSNIVGASVQLSGGLTFTNPINFNTTGTNAGVNNLGGINGGGDIENVSGNNIYSGSLTYNQDAGIGADAGSSLTITSGVPATGHILYLGGAGNINFTTSQINALYAISKVGSGTLTIQVPVSATTNNNFNVVSGTVVLSSAATTDGKLSVGANDQVLISPTATLTIDDSQTGTAVANRLGGNNITLTGGNLNYIGNTSAASSETTGSISFNRGFSVVTVTENANQQANLTFGAPNNPTPAQTTAGSGATVLFRGTNLGSAPGLGVATIKSGTTGFTFPGQGGAAGTTNKGILPWALVDTSTTGSGISFATADTATSILRPLSSTEYVMNTFTANNNISLNSGTTTIPTTVSINSLTIGSNAGVSINSLQSLTIQSGGILALSGTSSSISGGILSDPNSNSPLTIWTLGNLAISSVLNGGSGNSNVSLVKSGAGTLTLSPIASSITGVNANTMSGQTVIDLGTLVLNGGTNTLQANNFLEISPNGTLDLNGNVQYVQGLFSDGVLPGMGGTIMSSSGTGTLVVNNDNTARTWAGSITGSVFFDRSGQNTLTLESDNNYTGATVLMGGTLTLRDSGRLSATSSIDINYSNLTIDNSFMTDLTDRVNNNATITLRGGVLQFNGHAQSASTETLGPVVIAQGSSDILVNAGGTGVNSSDLTIASLTQSSVDATINFRNQANLGLVGSNARLLITSAPTLANNIIGAWAVVGGNEFASYIPGLGLGALNTVGFAGYDNTVFPATSQPTQNIRLAATAVVPTGGLTINTLNMPGNISLTFGNASDVLNLAAGGLLKSGNNTASIGGSVDSGELTAGGTQSTGTAPLYIHINAATANPLTINSRIVDNPNGAKVRLVFTSYNGGILSLTDGANSYSGGTVVDGWTSGNTGSLTLNGAAGQVVLPAGGLTISQSTVTEVTNSGQINPANIVTLVGASTLNLVGSNTLAGLVFNNNGGVSNPTVSTNGFIPGSSSPVLTLTGPITASSSNVTTTSTLAGRVDFGAAGDTITVNQIMVNGQAVAPLQATLILQGVVGSAGGFTKNGAGVLQINATEVYTGPTHIAAGGLNFGIGGSGLTGNNNAGSRFSDYTVDSGAFINMNANDGTIGSLSGAGMVLNSGPSTKTLDTGFDNTSTTFSGGFIRFNDALATGVQVNKIGTGMMTLTGVSNSTSNLQLSMGGVTVSGNGTTMFANNLVLTGGTLIVDDTGLSNIANRLGGTTTSSTLTMNGGEFKLLGGSGAATTESFGTIGIASGSSVITLVADPGQSLALNWGANNNSYTAGATLLIRGTNLGSAAGPGVANLVRSGTLNVSGGQGNGLNGTTNMNVRPDYIGDTSATGLGIAFVTQDTSTGVLRPLAGSEMATTLTNSASTNFALSTNSTITSNQSLNTVVLNSGGGISLGNPAAFGAYGANGGLVTETMNSGGVLAQSGNVGINVGALTSANAPYYFYSIGNTTSLSVTGYLTSAQNLTKSGNGSMSLNSTEYYVGATTVNAGSLTLNGGTNTLLVTPTASVPTVQGLTINGGSVDLNGNSQIVGTLNNNNTLANSGGTITNSVTGAPVNLVSVTGAASTFGGVISGNLNFAKTGNNALTLTSPNTYTGTTTIRGNTLTLRDSGTLAGTPSVAVNFAGLTIDQTGLNPSGNLDPVRIAATVPLTLQGGTFTLSAGGSVDSTATFNNVTLLAGGSTINVGAVANTGTTGTLNIGSLTTASGDATVNFVGGGAAFFNAAPALGNSEVYIGSINGTPTAGMNGFIGGWAVVNGGEFAAYTTTANGTAWGIEAMNSTGALYSSATIAAGSNPTSTVRLAAAAAIPSGGSTIQALSVPGAFNITFTTATDILNVVSGGILKSSNNANSLGGSVDSGMITAGGSQSTGVANMYLYNYSNTYTVNSRIIDNPAGAKLRLVLTATGGTISLTDGLNSYSGGTVLNNGTLTLNGAASAVVIPAGGLTINNGTVTMATNAGQINVTNDVTLNGGSTLTLVGSNTLNSVTFNNSGGTTTPTVATATSLTLTASNAVTSTNDNFGTTPTISGTALVLSNAAPVISVTGQSLDSLVISAPITSAGGAITKSGNGALVLNGANTFTNGVNLNSGSLIVDNNAAIGSGGTLTIGANTTILSGTAARTIANPVTVNGNFTFGGTLAVNSLTLSGATNLASNSTVTVTSPLVTGTLSGVISGPGGLGKAGAGTLVLSNSSNSYAGATTITGGVLQLGIANAIPATSDLSIAIGSELNLNGFSDTVGSLSGQGIVTNSSATIATLFAGADGANTTFDGILTASTLANLIFSKVGSGTIQLTNAGNNYGGGTAVNGGTFMLSGSTSVTTTGTGVFAVDLGGTVAGTGLLPTMAFNAGSAASVALPSSVAPTNGPIVVGSGGLSINGGTTINVTGTPTLGQYELISYGNASGLTQQQFANLKLGSTPGGGFLYSLVNDTANKSIDVMVEAVSTNAFTWTGAVSNTWDTSSANWNGTGTVYSDGSNVTFNDFGSIAGGSSIVNISGATVQPQSVAVNNSAVTYSIGASIGGNMAAGLTKSGNGRLILSGTNTYFGPTVINGGTVEAVVSSTSSGLGSSAITLGAGTTLQFDPVAQAGVGNYGLTGRGFGSAATNNFTTAFNYVNQTAANTATYFNSGTSSINPAGSTGVAFYSGGPTSNFTLEWTGKLAITTPGSYAFFLNSDDGSRVYIDGQLVTNADGGKGVGAEQGGTTMLSAGLHDIRIDYTQGTGNDGFNLSYQGPGVSKQLIPFSVLFTPETSSSTGASNLINLGNNITQTGNATINLNGANFTGVQVGSLSNSAGQTLTVTGNAGKLLRSGATILSGGGSITYNTTPDLALGAVSDGGTAVTINKTGSGRLIFDASPVGGLGSASSLVAGSTINVQGGTVVVDGIANGANPIGSASIALNGGNVLFDTQAGSVTYNNAVTLQQNGVMQVQPDGGGTVNVTLGGNISLNAKSLTIDTFGGSRTTGTPNTVTAAGATLQVNGVISGSGNLTLQSTPFNAELLPVPGAVILTAANTLNGGVTINGVYTNTANPLNLTLQGAGTLSALTGGITVNAGQLTIDDSATNLGNRLGANPTVAVPVTLNGGTLQFNANNTASTNTTESVGTVTLGGGFNQIRATNAPTGATIALTSNSLVRQNNATVAFFGTTLGGAATAADGIKYATAPTLSGGGGAAGTTTVSILPWAIGASNASPIQWGLVTYDANGIRPLAAAEYSTLGAMTGTTMNVRSSISSATTTSNTGVVTPNAYVIDNSSTTAAQTLTLNAGSTLTPTTGVLMFTATSATQQALTLAAGTGASVAFTNEGIITVTDTAGAAISAPITASNGITVSGFGNLTLSGANTITGPVTVNGTELIVSSGAIGLTSATPIQLGGGSQAVGGTNTTGGGFIKFNSAGMTLAQSVTLEPNSFGGFDTGAQSGTVSGQISGSGNLVKIGNNTLTLTNTSNNYTGQTYIYGGTLVGGTSIIPGNVVDNAALTFSQSTSGIYSGTISGIGSVTVTGTSGSPTISFGGISGGNFDPTNATAGANTYVGGTTISAATTLQGTTTSIQGSVNVSTASTSLLTLNQNFSGTFQGVISGAGSVNLAGTGTVTFNGPNTYTGATNIAAGKLILTNTPVVTPASPTGIVTLGATNITVASGATLAAYYAPIAASTTNNVINAGLTGAGTVGATLTLQPGSVFDMADGTIKTFNLNQQASFSGFGMTIGDVVGTAPVLQFGLGSGAFQSDTLNVSSAVSIGATGGIINIVPLPTDTSLTPGEYLLMSAAGGLGSGLTLANSAIQVGGLSYQLSLNDSNASQEILTVNLTAVPGNAFWTGARDGNWSTLTATAGTNWATGPDGTVDTNQNPSTTTNVFFTANSASSLSTTLGASRSINSLNFTGSGTSASNPITIAGNTLTINATNANGNTAGSGINVAAGSGAVTISSSIILGNSQTWTNASTQTLTVSGAVTGTGTNLTTAGSGTIAMTGSSTYTGTTTVSSGTLLVSGSISGSTQTSITSGATLLVQGSGVVSGPASVRGTLGGNGTVSGAVSVLGGAVAPGLNGVGSVGNLKVSSSFSLDSASTLKMDLGGASSGLYDQVTAIGVNLASDAGTGATLALSLVNGYTPVPNDFLVVLLNNGGAITTAFGNTTTDTNPNFFGGAPFKSIKVNGYEFAVSYNATATSFTGGHDIALLAIPEPNTAATLIAGLGSLIGLQRFRRRR